MQVSVKWLLSAGAIGLTIPRAQWRGVLSTRALVSDWVSGGRVLLAIRSIAENIKKARRAFFLYDNIEAVFQGDLSPVTSRSVVESCVMPVLLFGCENWVMTRAMTEKLGSF